MGSGASKKTSRSAAGGDEGWGGGSVTGGGQATTASPTTTQARTAADRDTKSPGGSLAEDLFYSNADRNSPESTKTPNEEDEMSDIYAPQINVHQILNILSNLFQKTSKIQQRDSQDKSYTEEFCSHISQIQSSYFTFQKFDVQTMREGKTKAGKLLVSSGSVAVLCDTMVDIMKYDTNRITETEVDLFEEAAVALLNYTDHIAEVTYAVKEHGRLMPVILEKLREWIKFHTYDDETEHHPFASDHMTELLLGIPHNIGLQDANIPYLRELKTSEVFMLYLQLQSEQPKLIALATLADIVTDEEAERLATSPDLAQFLLTILKKSLTSHQHTYGGWRVAELVRAVCHLARNDANKLLLVEQGALPLLVDGIKSQLKDEKDGSMEAVWALSLHKDNSQSFLQNETLLDLVVEVHKDKSQSDTCRRAAEGILWQLRHELEKVEKYATVAQQFTRNSSAKSKSGHVMLSYQWAHQPLVKRLHDLLEQQGIRVWMDIHKMGCSTRQSMAEAVEKAYIVLCCMSAKYKDSLPCRQEAEYADDLRKTIIPLKMERDYKADGWLGLMVAGKLFYDFSGKYPFDTKFQELVKAVREAGDVIPRDDVDGYVAPEPDVEDVGPVMKLEKRILAYTVPTTHQAAAPDLEKIKQWSRDDVVRWTRSFNLHGKKLDSLTGEQIAFLHRLRTEAPEFFYNMLRTELQIKTLPDLLQITKALDSLANV